jgi:hypothetical protein
MIQSEKSDTATGFSLNTSVLTGQYSYRITPTHISFLLQRPYVIITNDSVDSYKNDGVAVWILVALNGCEGTKEL